MAAGPKIPLQTIDQVCVVVDDLQRAMERYWSLFGIGPWRVWTYGPAIMSEMTYLGRPAKYTMRIALARVGSLVYEIIEPLAGENIYRDFLAARGSGLHHVGVFVDNIDSAAASLVEEGYQVVMSGRGFGAQGDGAFAYMGTEDDLAAIFELIQAPRERRPPEVSYP